MVRVKICGITNPKDAELAVSLGADAIGFLFAESPRRISSKQAKEICAAAGPYVTKVGVFVNFTAERIADIAADCRLDAIQLHGDESPEFCKKIGVKTRVVKTFRMGELFSSSDPSKFDVDAYLFETDASVRGGSGKVWNWDKFSLKKYKKPCIVAGGLTPSNVKKAIEKLRPYAVDVSSGVEDRPGFKNKDLMEKFIRNAKSA